MTTADNEKMIERVRALLAKAERTNNHHEAEAFFAKATELMDKYRIDDAAVRDRPAQYERLMISLSGIKFLRPTATLLGVIARHYGVVALLGTPGSDSVRTMILVGEHADIEAVQMMFTSLIIQRDRAALAAPVPPGRNANQFRQSFALGYNVRISARLKEIREAQVAVATSDGNTTALEVYDRRNKVMEMLGNPGTANHNRPNVDGKGMAAGHEAAATADLGGKRVGTAGPRELGR